MEAATPLRQPRVHTLVGRLIVEHLVVDDTTAAEFVRERVDAGEDGARVVADAVEIGARVIAREQAEVNADFVRTEFEKVSREVEAAFADKARVVAEFFGTKVDEVFGPENGHLQKELQRHFGDGSSTAVQHQLRQVMTEVSGRMREDLLRQFSSGDGNNPLADFKNAHIRAMRDATERQSQELARVREEMVALKLQYQQLQAERDKREEVAAEHERSTAKGRPYEDAVFEAVDAIAGGQGDDCDAVGDFQGVGGRKGDVLVGIDGCNGPARARIVFEAKNSQVPRKRALAELDGAMAQRDAAYAVWVVPSDDKLPARTQPLREVNGDKLFVVYDPEDGSTLGLEVAYRLARARALMARGDADGLDASALRAEVERALGAMEEVRRIKQQLTIAAGGIETARQIVESLDARVRAHLGQIDALLAPAAAAGDEDG
jgi:hypothetical protein